jgi:hypothetical protein
MQLHHNRGPAALQRPIERDHFTALRLRTQASLSAKIQPVEPLGSDPSPAESAFAMNGCLRRPASQ